MRWLVADVESSGFTEPAGVVELAWVEIDEDLQVLDRQYSLIDPEVPICPSASGIHGITADMLDQQPTLPEFFSVIYGGLITGPAVIVGHNIRYDRQFLDPYFEDLKGELCTLRLARRFFPDSPGHKLSTLMYFLNLERGKSHSAAGDVETTLDLLRTIVQVSNLSLPDLMGLAKQPLWVKKWAFGKNKDKPLDADMGYVKWALDPKKGLFKPEAGKQVDTDLKWSLEQVSKGVEIPV